MKDLRNKVADYIDTLSLYSITYLDVFPTTPIEAVMLRAMPSTAKETAYMDGSAEGSVSFNIYARSKTQNTAVSALDKIVKALDCPQIELEEGLYIVAQPTTFPALVQKTDAGEYTYSCAIKINYTWEAQ